MNIDWQHCRGPAAMPGPADFYQREEFHDLDRARWHLGRALAARMTVASCEIFNVWYLPRRSLQVIYTVSGADGSRATVTADFLPRGESRASYRKASGEAGDAAHVLHCPDWDCVARLFPEDPGLPALASMLDPRSLARLAPAVGGTAQPPAGRPALLAYLPGKRCVLRYDSQPGAPAFVGKLQESAEASHHAMQQLWWLPGRRFGMAEPIDCDARSGVRWERWVPGRRLDQLIPDIGLDNALREVLSGLAQLHRTPVSGRRPQRPREVLTRLRHKVLPRIRDSLGTIGSACDAFADRLADRADEVTEGALGTVHGDLHTANVLIGPGGPVLIDLDSLAFGDPAFDLALLGSRLLLIDLVEGHATSGTGSLGAGRGSLGAGRGPLGAGRGPLRAGRGPLVERLPEIYADAGGHPIPAETFAWYMAAMLVGRQIKTCIRHLAPSAGTLAWALLRTAEATLERGRFEADLVVAR